MPQPKLLEVAINDLVPNPWNTNIVTPANQAKLEASITRNGMFKPIITREKDGKLEIIGGEHRWEVGKKLGLATVPVVNLGEIDDKRAKEIGVLDNARYGADDTLSFGELLKEIGGLDELQEFLPYADADLRSIFSASDIALDDLDLLDPDEKSTAAPEPPAAREPKTHTIMRFKVPLRDSEKITALIARTQKTQNLTGSDELTNAGDALVHLLVSQFLPETSNQPDAELDELEGLLDQIGKETAA